MLSSQRGSPLKPEQGKKHASQQGVADIIHEGELWHGIGDPVSKGTRYKVKKGVKAMRGRIALLKHFARNVAGRCYEFREALEVALPGVAFRISGA